MLTMSRPAVFLLAALGLTAIAGCTDEPVEESGGSPSPVTTRPTSTASVPTRPVPSLTALPTPDKPWPAPTVTGAPEPDAPLAQRIRFAVAKQAQIAAGKAATTTVSCPGLNAAEEPGEHNLTCTVTYAGHSYPGRLTVNAKQYSATYRFTSDSVPVVKDKVVDAVLRTAPGAAKVTCTMDAVAVVKPTDPKGIACEVTTAANAVQSYRAQVSGDGSVLVAKA
jgi:hypothetical protein